MALQIKRNFTGLYQKFFRRSKGVGTRYSDFPASNICRNSLGNIFKPHAGCSGNSRNDVKKYFRRSRFRFLTDHRGSSNLIGFIVFLPVSIFLVFGVVDYYTFGTRHQSAEHIKNYYLERICVEGFLTIEDEEDLKKRFDDSGLAITKIDAPRESQGQARILRDNSNPFNSEVWLVIEAQPKGEIFVFGSLLGSGSPDNPLISVGGRRLSERIDP